MRKIFKLFLASLIIMTGVLMSDAKSQIDPNADKYTEVHAAHILVDTKSQANAVKYRIEGGEDFAKVAKQFSKCPSGQRGGRAPPAGAVPPGSGPPRCAAGRARRSAGGG